MTLTAPELRLPVLASHVSSIGARVRLLAAVSPLNWDDELERLTLATRSGANTTPRFLYRERADASATADEASFVAEQLAGLSLGPAFAAVVERATEVALEARLVASIGTREFRVLAAARYRSTAEDDERALGWAKRHAGSDAGDDEPRSVSDDESDPASLISQTRRAIGLARLPFRVTVRRNMAALAATGDGVVLIAAGRRLRTRDVTRTVIHELEGHVAPALRRPSNFRRAGEADREEGEALFIEQRAGMLDRGRRHELALRHVAACAAHEGASFLEVVRALSSLGGAPPASVRIAARAMRGGGLGRERVYLASYFRLVGP